jgi:exodeoxyribonuclease VII large subunit
MRKRLEAEGLFEGHHKKPIPYLPGTIGIITSSKGAVIHDILTIIDQRFPNRSIRIVSVKVQGAEAADEIANAIGIFNQNCLADVIVIARGGGSMEDLQPFNTETVARAVFESDIPIVSAVGHESDFSICDFVADLRAPTPTAAAEMVVPKKRDLIVTISGYKQSLQASIHRQLARVREMVNDLHSRIKHPIHKIGDLRVHLDNLLYRASMSPKQRIRYHRIQVKQNHKQLHSTLPVVYLHDNILKVAIFSQRAQKAILSAHRERTLGLKRCSMVLQALSPLRVLERGYSITRHPAPNGQVVTCTESVATGQELEIILAKGLLKVKITDKKNKSN